MGLHLNYPARLRATLALSLFCLLSLIFSSCEEGPGGTALLSGVVMVQDVNVLGQVVAEYPALEERVYLIYGTEPGFGDDTRTHFDGTFRFENLRNGDYRVYAYSDCESCPSGKEAVIVDVTLNGDTEAPTITIVNNL